MILARDGLMVPTEQSRYAFVFRFYSHLMTMQERLAYRHLVATAKAMHGRTDVGSQTEARNSRHQHLVTLLSNDPEVLRLASEGLEAFATRIPQRMLAEHSGKVAFNNCPQCGAVARTPRARQCRFCGFDWHAT